MKRKLFTGIVGIAGALLLSFTVPSDNKAPNFKQLENKIEHEHKGESGWYPCHPAGDIGPCGHYNYWGYKIHDFDVYPCGHVCY